MWEHEFSDLFNYTNLSLEGNKFTCKVKFNSPYGNDKEVEIEIIYDPNADYEYFTNCSCKCDGTLMFLAELAVNVVQKLLTLQTYNKNKIPPNDDLWKNGNYKIRYTVGNFVFASEFGKEFTEEGKPWMLTKFTAMLPIKNEFIKL